MSKWHTNTQQQKHLSTALPQLKFTFTTICKAGLWEPVHKHAEKPQNCVSPLPGLNASAALLAGHDATAASQRACG